MNHDVVVPSPGESVSSGILAKWLKADGATVRAGEELFELETDKATMAVPASADGVLHRVTPEGQEVQVGDVVASIDTAASAPVTSPQPDPKPKADTRPQPDQHRTPNTQHPTSKSDDPDFDVGRSMLDVGRSPEITHASAPDARAEPPTPAPPPIPTPQSALRNPPSPPPSLPAGRQTRERMTSLRKRIADNLVQSQRNAAHLTTFNEIDMDRFMTIRKTHGEAFEKRHGVKLGFMSIFVKACCRALADYPGVNAMIDGDDLVFNHFANVGVAVSTERGLIVPVIHDADDKTFADIEKEIKTLAEKARAKALSVDNLTGGTFTITNGGIFGSLLSTPIPTPPQTAILGMHTIQKRAVVVNDAIVIRPMMYVALTYDHRVIDGREAVGFLVRVKQVVEEPDSLLFDL